MKIGLASHEMSLGGQVAPLASGDDGLERCASVVWSGQTQKRPSASEIQLGDGLDHRAGAPARAPRLW